MIFLFFKILLPLQCFFIFTYFLSILHQFSFLTFQCLVLLSHHFNLHSFCGHYISIKVLTTNQVPAIQNMWAAPNAIWAVIVQTPTCTPLYDLILYLAVELRYSDANSTAPKRRLDQYRNVSSLLPVMGLLIHCHPMPQIKLCCPKKW